MQVTEITAGYTERRQLKQYELSAEVHTALTATIDADEDEEEAHTELMKDAKALAGREMQRRVDEYQMTKELDTER